MSDYEFTLPWPPTTNHYHIPIKVGKGVRCIKSPKIKEYQDRVVEIIKDLGLDYEMIAQPVTISIYMHPPTNRKFDRSNFLKAYEDGLVNSGFLEDDHWIDYGFIRKAEKVPGGKLVVIVNLSEVSK